MATQTTWVRSLAVFVGAWIVAPAAHAAYVVVDDADDLYTVPNGDLNGDFVAVAGTGVASAPGQVYDVLQLQDNGSESGSNAVDMGDLWVTLDTGGLASATTLVFGFGINETGAVGSNSVTVTELVMTFELPDASVLTYDLAPDIVEVFNYEQGQNTAEALFQVALPFDFMTTYSAASTEQFTISSSIDNTSDGFEIFFLSSGYTERPPLVPAPPALALLGLGLLRTRRRRA
jgi:hypothetical protein